MHEATFTEEERERVAAVVEAGGNRPAGLDYLLEDDDRFEDEAYASSQRKAYVWRVG